MLQGLFLPIQILSIIYHNIIFYIYYTPIGIIRLQNFIIVIIL